MKNLTFIILVAVLSFVALTIVHAYAMGDIDLLSMDNQTGTEQFGEQLQEKVEDTFYINNY